MQRGLGEQKKGKLEWSASLTGKDTEKGKRSVTMNAFFLIINYLHIDVDIEMTTFRSFHL